MKRKNNQGFTLIELMIVVAIIAILASVAYPAYTAYTFKVHRSGAQQALKAFAMAMEKVRLEQQEYQKANNTAGPLSDVTPIAALFPSQAPLDSSNKTYNLTVTATKDTFILKATPITGSMMDGDGHLELHSTGRKGWDQDGGGISATEWCWETSRRSC